MLKPSPSDDKRSMNGDKLKAAVITAFLAMGKRIDLASSLLLITIPVFLLPGATWTIQAVALAAFVLAVAQKVFAWRVALDVELFRVLQQFPADAAEFDAALSACLGRDAPSASRSLHQRWLGARRLLSAQLISFATQAVCTGALILLIA